MHKPEEYEKTKVRFKDEERMKEDTKVKMRLRNKLTTMFSNKNLNSLIAQGVSKTPIIPRNDSLRSLISPERSNEFEYINDMIKNKQAIGGKKLQKFEDDNNIPISS